MEQNNQIGPDGIILPNSPECIWNPIQAKVEFVNSKARAPQRSHEGDLGYDFFIPDGRFYVERRTSFNGVPTFSSVHSGPISKDSALAETNTEWTRDLVREDEAYLIQPGDIVKVWLGLKIQMPMGWGIEMRNRSSIASGGMRVCCGLIDNAYRGEIILVIQNMLSSPQFIFPGQKISQGKIITVPPRVDYERVDSLSTTSRGEGGFGSTGI